MIRQSFSIAGYWDVIVLYFIDMNEYDAGFTKTYFNERRSIIGISYPTSQEQLFNTLVHEAKHLQSHICRYYNVPEDGEQAAYLIGYIIQQMHKAFRKFISTKT